MKNKLTTKPFVEFLKTNGRSNSLTVAGELKVAFSTARKYLQMAVESGLVLRQKVGVYVFYTAILNPKPKKQMGPNLDKAPASAHLNNVWGWVKS